MRNDIERALQANGFAFESVKGLEPQPWLKYYSLDKMDGKIVEHRLPSDPYSLNHYLKKGFVLNPSELKPQVKEESFTCETCGKSLKTRLALAGHSRTHAKLGG